MNCECCKRLIADNKRLVEEREQLLSVLKDEREAIGRYVVEANVAKANLDNLRGALIQVTHNYCE